MRAQAQLALALAPTFWWVAIHRCLSQLCEQAWQRHAVHTALLRSPRLTVPAILEACAKPRFSIAKAVAIILAASEATGPRISPEMQERLQILSKEDLPFVKSQSPIPPPNAQMMETKSSQRRRFGPTANFRRIGGSLGGSPDEKIACRAVPDCAA